MEIFFIILGSALGAVIIGLGTFSLIVICSHNDKPNETRQPLPSNLFKTVAFYKYNGVYSNTKEKYYFTITLKENGFGKRTHEIQTSEDYQYSIENLVKNVKSQYFYNTSVIPWCEGTLSTAALKAKNITNLEFVNQETDEETQPQPTLNEGSSNDE